MAKSLGVGTWTSRRDLPEETTNYLQQVQQKDAEMDQIELARVGEQIGELKDVAREMNQRVTGQTVMIDPITNTVMNQQEHVSEIQRRLKEAAKKGKKWGRLPLNVFCMLLLIGQLVALAFLLKYILTTK